MRTVVVSGSDTDVGKTHVIGALARFLGARGEAVQIVKPVETGRRAGEPGDADRAAQLAGGVVETVTLLSFPEALAPAAAAARAGGPLSFENLVAAVRRLPSTGCRLIEGAGGIASPIDDTAHDWVDFAGAIGADLVAIVVPNRVGAIGQARMAFAHAARTGLPTGLWLNSVSPVDPRVYQSNLDGFRAAGIPLWGELAFGQTEPVVHEAFRRLLETKAEGRHGGRPPGGSENGGTSSVSSISVRAAAFLAARERDGIRRRLRVTARDPSLLNLADNDYLDLARDPAVARAVAEAARTEGTSASASALITGWTESHERLLADLGSWHGLSSGLIWSSGYAANSAILGTLPGREDLVLADRLIHHSMIAGILRSGARLQRYDHLDLDHLEEMLGKAAGRTVFVATETVFSMDGDYPDLRRLAEMKRKHGFFWIVDEAHALGWYGPGGSGLVRAAGVEKDVDLLVGTFGKALAAGGAYSLFQDAAIRDQLVNTAGEFIYSTALPPTSVAAAAAAMARVGQLASGQARWQATSRAFRSRLREAGWAAPDGNSPIVPVIVGSAEATTSLAEKLRSAGILAGAVRPPTVPAGSGRLRFSLKRTFDESAASRVLAAMGRPSAP